MLSATNLMFLNMATAKRADANYAVIRSNQAQENLLSSNNMDMNSVHRAEKNIMFGSLRAQTQAKIAAEMEKSIKERDKRDSQKQLDTFA